VVACGIGGIHDVRAEERRKIIYDRGFGESIELSGKGFEKHV
jgi:hypothetical protein